MRTADQWFDIYQETHRHPVNRAIHRLCAPIAALALIGLLWSLPVPDAFTRISPALNWGSTFIMAAIVYYFILSIMLGLGMVAIVLGIVAVIQWLDGQWIPLWLSTLGLLAGAFIAMFAGHNLEGRRWQIISDLQLIMIAPVFLLAALYRRLGIAY
jgi:uncharacterized membrane protein YGL010W